MSGLYVWTCTADYSDKESGQQRRYSQTLVGDSFLQQAKAQVQLVISAFNDSNLRLVSSSAIGTAAAAISSEK